jgi:IclR family mhp operon transcriptional activator
MPAFDPVTALVRGLEVLRVVNQLEHASVTEIHRRTGIPKPTVLRMIETLISQGFVVREAGSATYTPTGRCLLLSNGIRAHAHLVSTAQPLMNAFRRKVGWPSDFAVFDSDAMVITVTNREFGVLSLNRKVGARTPMLLSALGRAYLAFCTEDEQQRVIATLRNSPDPLNRAAQNPKVVVRMLRETRKRGYSLTDRNYLDTVYEGAIWGVGVPILAGGRVLASMNVMFLRNALSLEAGIASVLPSLQQAAREIGAEMDKDTLGHSVLA